MIIVFIIRPNNSRHLQFESSSGFGICHFVILKLDIIDAENECFMSARREGVQYSSSPFSHAVLVVVNRMKYSKLDTHSMVRSFGVLSMISLSSLFVDEGSTLS